MKTIIAVLCLAVSMCSAVDYCNNTLLQCSVVPHVACNNPAYSGGWGSGCQNANPRELTMTADMMAKILDIHNTFRQQQANGQTPNYPPANRMATVGWDSELAKLALTNARNCTFRHDNCRNKVEFRGAGQNIAVAWYKPDPNYYTPARINEIVLNMTRDWFATEYQNGNFYGYTNLINSYPNPKPTDPVVGHFTQVVTGDVYEMGCGITQWDAKESDNILYTHLYLVCDYSRSNDIGSNVYTTGKTASACTTGTNPQYPALCSVNENYRGTYWYPPAGAH